MKLLVNQYTYYPTSLLTLTFIIIDFEVLATAATTLVIELPCNKYQPFETETIEKLRVFGSANSVIGPK